MSKKRLDLKVRMLLDTLGATMALVGLGGMAGASEGQGNMVLAIAVFLLGFAEVIWSYQR
jgi:hypothetical protein